MKRHKSILLLSMIFMFIFTMFTVENVKAEDIKTNVYNYKWQDDTLISGSSQIERTFYVTENMNCDNFTVSLKMKQSPTLVKDLSSISILVNKTEVYSIMMDKVDESGVVNFSIPSSFIQKGENSIIIKGFLKSTRQKCEINNDVNWVVLEKDSSFSFNYKLADSADISGIFEDTYYPDGAKGEINIALPDTLIENNYSKIASLSALIGFEHKNKETEIGIKNIRYSDLSNFDKEAIVIGTADQVKAYNKDLLNEEQWKSAEENGYIAIRKIGLKNHFIVIVSNEMQLETLCKTLGNKSSLAQLKGTDYALDKNKIYNEIEFNAKPSLSSLGYETSTQNGNGVKRFDYYFTIPAKRTLTENNKFSFEYTNSSLIDYDNGYVNVEVNGESLTSKKFSKGKVQDRIEVTIPKKYFEYSSLNITLKFNLKPDAEKCAARSYEDAWVTVDSNNSNFDLELKDRAKYSLLNSQGLLQDSNGYLDGSIAVDSLSNLSVDSICKLSSYLGKSSQGVNKLYLNEANDVSSSKAIISLTKSPIIKGINDNLRIPISENGEFFNKDLFVQNAPSLGGIELTSRGDKLVILADDKVQLNKTIEKFSEVTTSKDTVILKDGKVVDSFGADKVLEDKTLGAKNINYNIILGLAVLLGASITIFIIYFRKVK